MECYLVSARHLKVTNHLSLLKKKKKRKRREDSINWRFWPSSLLSYSDSRNSFLQLGCLIFDLRCRVGLILTGLGPLGFAVSECFFAVTYLIVSSLSVSLQRRQIQFRPTALEEQQQTDSYLSFLDFLFFYFYFLETYTCEHPRLAT